MEDPYEELATTAWLDLSDVDEIDDESVATEADGAIMRQAMGLPAEEFDTEERNDDEA